MICHGLVQVSKLGMYYCKSRGFRIFHWLVHRFWCGVFKHGHSPVVYHAIMGYGIPLSGQTQVNYV